MPNAKITLQDIYTINQQIYKRMDDMDERIEKIEARTSCIEIWRAEIVGRLAVTGFFILLLFNLAIDWVKNKFF